MRILILGATGLLGRGLMVEARKRKFTPLGAARSGTDYTVDLTQAGSLEALLDQCMPEQIINAAAMVNLAACEAEPDLAHQINAGPAQILAHWSAKTGAPFVQISTDHFFDGDGSAKHDEGAPTTLCNVYARSKFAAETYALKASRALVVRTSLAGFHPDGRGFAHWAMDALEHRKPLTLFDDFYGSLIDVQTFCAALFDVMAKNASGVFHLASREVSSKKQFILALADAAGINPDWAKTGSVSVLKPKRARSLGLEVSKAETLLGRTLPGRGAVCAALVNQWRAMP
jgi:dTDP-4-dehydrorhamnose reductase